MTVFRALLLAILLLPAAMATHEAMHVAVYYAFGYDSVLRLRPWDLGLAGIRLPGFHVAPTGAPPFSLRVLDDFLGPALAVVPSAVLITQVAGRAARAALLANVGVQAFFAVIEPGYLLIERVGRVEADLLLSPWLNYGGVLLIVVAVVWARSGRLAEAA